MGGALALSESAGEATAGTESLAIVALHREEVEAGTRVGPHGRAHDDRVAMADHDAAVSELCDAARLHTKGPAADFSFNDMNCGICHI